MPRARRARRRAGRVGGLRRRRPDRSYSCRPGRSSTRGSGRRRSRTSPGAIASSPGTTAATAARTGRAIRRPTRRASGPPNPGGHGRGRRPRRRSSGRAVVGRADGALVAAEHPERVDGAGVHRPRLPFGEPSPGRRAPVRRAAARRRGLGQVQRHYWRRDYDGFLEYFFPSASPSRTRRSRSRTASAGASRPTRDARRHRAPPPDARRCDAAAMCAASAARRWSSTAPTTGSRT